MKGRMYLWRGRCVYERGRCVYEREDVCMKGKMYV